MKTSEIEKLLTDATPGDWQVDGRMIAANPAVSIALLCHFDSFGGVHEAPNAAANGALMAASRALARELIEARRRLAEIAEKTSCQIAQAIAEGVE